MNWSESAIDKEESCIFFLLILKNKKIKITKQTNKKETTICRFLLDNKNIGNIISFIIFALENFETGLCTRFMTRNTISQTAP